MSQSSSSWWGRHSVPIGRSDFWQIGSLRLWIEHLPYRLVLRWSNGSDWLDAHTRYLPNTAFEKPNGGITEVTCAYGVKAPSDLVFSPSLPDRLVIVRSAQPVHVLPGEEVNAYLITPLWLRIDLPNPPRLVHEIPSYRMSDTWFGPPTVTGELAYSNPVGLLYDLREVPLRSHCVVTSIMIRNSGNDALTLDRLAVPYQRLSLFYSSQTGFWTDRIRLVRNEDNEMADLHIDSQAPPEASPSQFVSGPRQATVEAHHTFRAFSRIFERSPGE